ncbi:alpha/beta fold hydrolase [Mycobacterium sp. pUA109]|uniref:alpha/beta fold hydrolase n=1 Tax=Mycobacterium sp. pUA109 TaxID=3238982 RepID=UPI00351B2E00
MPEIDLSAGTIRYHDSGDGPPILFVHGLLVNASLWRKVIPALDGRFRCLAPDWPLGAHPHPMRTGADVSPHGVARLIAEFLDALDLDEVTVVANDTGGAVTQLMLVQGSPRIARVVLTPCDSFDNFLPRSLRALQYVPRVPGLMTLSAQLMRLRLLQRISFATLAKRPIPREVEAGWLRPVITDRGVRRDLGTFLRGIDYHDTLAAAEVLRGFGKPVLLLWPRKAPFFPFAHAQRWVDLLPDAHLVEVPDAYTFVPEDQPEFTAEAIASFVSRRADVKAPKTTGF